MQKLDNVDRTRKRNKKVIIYLFHSRPVNPKPKAAAGQPKPPQGNKDKPPRPKPPQQPPQSSSAAAAAVADDDVICID